MTMQDRNYDIDNMVSPGQERVPRHPMRQQTASSGDTVTSENAQMPDGSGDDGYPSDFSTGICFPDSGDSWYAGGEPVSSAEYARHQRFKEAAYACMSGSD